MTKTVLLIEDDSDLRLLVRRILERALVAINVHESVSGATGLALAVSAKPDLVLLDLNLPDMPGTEVVRRLRSVGATRSIPIAILSADVDEARRNLRDTVDEYISKPFEIDDLLVEVERMLSHRIRVAEAPCR